MAAAIVKRCAQLGSAIRTGKSTYFIRAKRSPLDRHRRLTAGRRNSCSCPPPSGIKQSPIDICTTQAKLIMLQPLSFCRHFDDDDGTFCMYTGDNTLNLVPEGGMRDMEGGPFSCKYYLVRVMFRWGRSSCEGSEHSLSGKKFPMEVQFMYVNYNYKRMEDARGHTEGVAMLSVLVKECDPDPMFGQLVECMSDLKPDTKQPLSINVLTPFKSIFESERYYTYEGSLTFKPPYCENVKWIVFEDLLSLDCQQIEAFRKLCGSSGPIAKNYRCQQAVNGRQMYKMSC